MKLANYIPMFAFLPRPDMKESYLDIPVAIVSLDSRYISKHKHFKLRHTSQLADDIAAFLS